MKRCPTCNKTFTDSNLIFCIDDGTPLVPIQEDEDERTQVRPSDHDVPTYKPPAYAPPGGSSGSNRSSWPWALGILGIVILVLGGLSVAAVILIPRMVKRSTPIAISNNNSNNSNNSNSSTGQNNQTENVNSNHESNSENLPPPTDKEVVLAQLKDLENEWTVANLNADKKKLKEILADDYVSPNAQGRMQGKVEYINTVERDTSVQKWELEDLDLTLRGDRATLTGKIHYHLQDREVGFNFVDRFVWREGRWQATGSEVSEIK